MRHHDQHDSDDTETWTGQLIDFLEAPLWLVASILIVIALLMTTISYALYMRVRGYPCTYGVIRVAEMLDELIEKLERKTGDRAR